MISCLTWSLVVAFSEAMLGPVIFYMNETRVWYFGRWRFFGDFLEETVDSESLDSFIS